MNGNGNGCTYRLVGCSISGCVLTEDARDNSGDGWLMIKIVIVVLGLVAAKRATRSMRVNKGLRAIGLHDTYSCSHLSVSLAHRRVVAGAAGPENWVLTRSLRF